MTTPIARCSVIIPSFMQPDSVIRILISLREQLDKNDEVIIVDDGSEPQCRELLESQVKALHMPQVTLLLEEHGGVSQARNIGIQKAHNALLLFTNQDSVTAPDWVSQMKQSLQRAEAVQGDYWTQATRSWIDVHHMTWRRVVGEAKRKHLGDHFGANTRNFGVYRKVLLTHCGAAPFRVDPSKHGGEDVLLGAQLRAAGVTIAHNPHASIRDIGDEHTLMRILRKKYTHGHSDSISGVIAPDTFKYGNFERTVILPVKGGVAVALAFCFWAAYTLGAARGMHANRVKPLGRATN